MIRLPRRAAAAALALTTVSVSSLMLLGAGTSTAAPSAATAVASGVTKERVIERVHLNADGSDTVAERKTFRVSVDVTKSLRSRQPVEVQWSGAHPTGRVIGDRNSTQATEQEYPVVVLECRGLDSSTLPAAQRMTRETCWSPYGRYRSSSDPFPAWRVDRRAPDAERRLHVGADPLPPGCQPLSAYSTERWLPFKAANGTVYNTNQACGRLPPEAAVVATSGQPTNSTFAQTLPDGTGSTKFTMWTEDDNASLGCSATVACSLVVVPVLGISCDATAASLPAADRPAPSTVSDVDTACRAEGRYVPGQAASGTGPALAVSGALWWSPSNWENRVSIPVTFSPSASICSAVGGKESVDIYGSELLNQATLQWQPALCTGAGNTPFKHVQVGEPQAKNLLSQGTIDAGFVASPPEGGYNQPAVNAPVAMTGFAIGYVVDDEKQKEYHSLRMTPRLLAKLLTQSYPAAPFVQDEYKALSGNPLNITLDPEFIALNPGLRRLGAVESSATLFSLSSDSDVISALTSYIDNSPEARAWLDGKPDPWGMVVNPNYKRIELPVENWPLLDAFEPKQAYAQGFNECLQRSPVPYLPLVAAPTTRMANISLGLQFALPNSTTTCEASFVGQTDGLKLTTSGRMTPGFRFMLGVTSLGDARRYDIDAAALQTYVDPNAPEKFSSAAGREFVDASDTGLRAAARMLRPDTDTMSWPIPYQRMATETAGAAAYPGAMMVYAAVPTAGLDKGEAEGYASFLRYVGTAGQAPGYANGQLPPGYLPMTSANGLAAQAAYARTAAAAVAAQKGEEPPLTPQAAAPGPTPSPSGGSGGTGGTGGTGGGAFGGGGGAGAGVGGGSFGGSGPTAGPGGGPGAHGAPGAAVNGSVTPGGVPGTKGVQPGANPVPQAAGPLGVTVAQSSGLAGAVLPLVALAAVVGGLVTPLLLAVNRYRP